jgi:hypothetical protein
MMRRYDGSPLRRLQELAARTAEIAVCGFAATKEVHPAGCLSERNGGGSARLDSEPCRSPPSSLRC